MLQRIIPLVALLMMVSQRAEAGCEDIGFLILRSSAVKESVYKPFIDEDCVRNGTFVFGNIDYNPLTANQIRDLERLQSVTEELAPRSARGIVVFGYSETGKFAAKLASLNPHVKALFLMDPVDGTPPFSSPKRFPVFLDANFPVLNIPATILESGLGPKFKRLGHSCVPENMGPSRFYKHIEPSKLTRVFMEDLGHADFLFRSGPNIVELMCGSGPLTNSAAFEKVLTQWKTFLERMSREL